MARPSNEITTPRLRLRPWTEADADRLLDIRRRPDVAQWLSDPNPWTDRTHAIDAIARWSSGHAEPGPYGVWAITSAESTVDPFGSVSLNRLPGSDDVEMGWYLHPDSVGRGYATEAARAILQHAFASEVSEVWAIMWPHNEPSARVAAAIGMTDLGVIDDPWYGTDEEPTSRMFRVRSADTDS